MKKQIYTTDLAANICHISKNAMTVSNSNLHKYFNFSPSTPNKFYCKILCEFFVFGGTGVGAGVYRLTDHNSILYVRFFSLLSFLDQCGVDRMCAEN